MIQGKYLSTFDNLSDVKSIRNTVFINELNYPDSYINDSHDELSIHAVAIDENSNTVGCGRITLILNDDNSSSYYISLVCVLKEFRKQGFGEFIVRLLADKAMLSGGEKIFIECTNSTRPFFEKLYFTLDEETNNICKMSVELSQFKSPCSGCK